MPKVQVNDINIYYKIFSNSSEVESINTTSPTLIVLHGGPGIVDHAIEVEFWSRLSNKCQVLFLDQRGCGKTDDGSEDRWSIKQCGEDIHKFCEALNIERPIVAGVSWGGYVVMSYAISHPTHPSALIFCSTEAKIDSNERRRMFNLVSKTDRTGEFAFKHDINPTIESTKNYFDNCGPYFSKTPFNFVQPSRVNMKMRLKFTREENLKLDFREPLSQIECPVLLLAGENDPAHPVKCARETAECIPEEFRNFHIIKDTGAPAYQERPEEIVQIIFNFMEDVFTKEQQNTERMLLN